MKLWFTRSGPWDLMVGGISRCTVWRTRPVYNRTLRGATDMPIFEARAIGWKVYEAGYDVTSDSCTKVRKLLRPYPILSLTLFRAVAADIEPRLDVTQISNSSDLRWSFNYQCALEETGAERETEFCLELDVAPDLWIQVMQQISGTGVSYAAWVQSVFRADLPF